MTAATVAITIVRLFVENWEGFTLAACLVLKAGCTYESLLIKNFGK